MTVNDPQRPPMESWPPPIYAAQPPGLPYDRDGDHLRLLSVFYSIWGVLTILGSCFLLVDLVMGLAMLSHPQTWTNPRPPPVPPYGPHTNTTKLTGEMLVAVGGGGTILGWILGVLTICADRCLAVRRHPVFIMVMAALNWLSVPLGTPLGIFTFVVTARPTVKALFAADQA